MGSLCSVRSDYRTTYASHTEAKWPLGRTRPGLPDGPRVPRLDLDPGAHAAAVALGYGFGCERNSSSSAGSGGLGIPPFYPGASLASGTRLRPRTVTATTPTAARTPHGNGTARHATAPSAPITAPHPMMVSARSRAGIGLSPRASPMLRMPLAEVTEQRFAEGGHRTGPGSGKGGPRPWPAGRSAVVRVVDEDLLDGASRQRRARRVAFEVPYERDQRLPQRPAAAA
jgi:hypothetical protein